jgi:hypothetical protein
MYVCVCMCVCVCVRVRVERERETYKKFFVVFNLLELYVVYIGSYLPTIWDSLSVLSSSIKGS